ncbi:MAG: DUF2182 domain-containing protein [Pseudomonadota bacterium]
MSVQAAAGTTVPAIRPEAMSNPGLVWPLSLGALGWLVLALGAQRAEPLALCLGLDLPSMGRFRTNFDAMLFYADPLAISVEWMAMVAGMMLPLAAVGFGRLVMRAHRLQRACLLVAALLGYVAIWALLGPVVILAIFAVRAWAATAPETIWPNLAPFALAILWTLSPLRRRLLIAAHRVPLLFGPPHTQSWDAVGYGLTLGRRCALVCLPIMAAPMISGLGVIAMLLTTHVLLAERLTHEPRAKPIRLALILLAGLTVIP